MTSGAGDSFDVYDYGDFGHCEDVLAERQRVERMLKPITEAIALDTIVET
jgi:hypothetical protein